MISKIISALKTRFDVYIGGTFSMVPKLIFGNTVGFRYNVIPMYHLKKLQKEFKQVYSNQGLPADSKINSNINHLHEYGYVCPAQETDMEQIKVIQQKYQSMITDSTSSISSPNGFTRFLLDPVQRIPEIKSLLNNSLISLLSGYYQTGFSIKSVRCWRNLHAPDYDANSMDAFSNTFHHDRLPVTGLRVFILLSDNTTKKTGALRFLDRKYSQKLVRSFHYFHRFKLSKGSIKKITDPTHLKYFEGKLGDTCICNTQQCLHAASIPEKNSYRDILQFEIYPNSGPLLSQDEFFVSIPPDNLK